MFWKKESSPLNVAYERACRQLALHEVGSQEYVKTLGLVTRLNELRREERSPTLSKDTMLVVGANLLGILMIIKHEHVNVVTSRAMGLLMRPK